MLRPVTIAVLLVAPSLAPACGAPTSQPASDAHATPAPRRDAPSGVLPDERQILWQRDLEQALALARAEDRPLFIAVNMDGESASDRIVCENYRGPPTLAHRPLAGASPPRLIAYNRAIWKGPWDRSAAGSSSPL